MARQFQLRLVGAGVGAPDPADLTPEIRAALVQLADDLDDETCIVLTRAGVLPARADPADPTLFHLCNGEAATRTGALYIPRWDSAARVLTFGGRIVKQFERPSPNQEAILNSFEEAGWPCRVDDPLPPKDEIAPKTRLHDTIRWLNRNQKDRLLRFLGDGTGEGVRWRPVATGALVLPGDAAKPQRRAA